MLFRQWSTEVMYPYCILRQKDVGQGRLGNSNSPQPSKGDTKPEILSETEIQMGKRAEMQEGEGTCQWQEGCWRCQCGCCDTLCPERVCKCKTEETRKKGKKSWHVSFQDEYSISDHFTQIEITGAVTLLAVVNSTFEASPFVVWFIYLERNKWIIQFLFLFLFYLPNRKADAFIKLYQLAVWSSH